MENNPRISVADLESLKIRLESLDLKLRTLETDKKALKEEAETLQIRAELLRVKARSVEILSTEILKDGSEILCQIKYLADTNDLGDLRQKLANALEPIRSHFLSKDRR